MSAADLRGERVLLRQWRDSDRAAFAAMNSDPAVMQYFIAALTQAESDALLDRFRAALDARGWGLWCVDIDGECAGFTGLSMPSFEAHFTPCVEIGWRLRPHFWRRGYATEAARLALEHGFRILELPEIVSFTALTNRPSRAVMERLRMQRDPADDFDHPRITPGHPLCRHVLYRLARKDAS